MVEKVGKSRHVFGKYLPVENYTSRMIENTVRSEGDQRPSIIRQTLIPEFFAQLADQLIDATILFHVPIALFALDDEHYVGRAGYTITF